MIDILNNTITDYKLVLVKDVMAEIKNGWTLYGNPIYGTVNCQYQAVIKFVPKPVGVTYS